MKKQKRILLPAQVMPMQERSGDRLIKSEINAQKSLIKKTESAKLYLKIHYK